MKHVMPVIPMMRCFSCGIPETAIHPLPPCPCPTLTIGLESVAVCESELRVVLQALAFLFQDTIKYCPYLKNLQGKHLYVARLI